MQEETREAAKSHCSKCATNLSSCYDALYVCAADRWVPPFQTIQVYCATVLRALRSNVWTRFAKRKRAPSLKPHHKKNRVAFALKCDAWQKRWCRVVFMDEKKFNLDGPDGFRYYWCDVRQPPEFYSRRVSGGGV
jgi:hypothetical protein